MTAEESPVVARRRLRLALRGYREKSGMTQSAVSKRLEWSLSKVNRIELGEVTVSLTDLQALLRLYDINDESQVALLTHHCRSARQRGWWDEPRYRTHATPATIDLLQYEGDAVRINIFHSTLIPGIAQIRAYSTLILDSWSHELSPVEREARLDFRVRRRDHIFNQAEPPECLMVLDESVVSRELGGPGLMIEQLKDLLASIDAGRIQLHILPLNNPTLVAIEAPFVVLDLDDGDSVLYREGFLADELVDNREQVESYRRLFHRLIEISLPRDASARLIEARVAALVSSLDRR